MSTLLENSIYTPQFLTKTFQTVATNMNNLQGESILPFTPRNVSLVKIHRKNVLKGLTSPVAPNAESKIREKGGATLKQFSPVEFREKSLVFGDDLVRMVNFQEDPMSASQIIEEHMTEIAVRAKLRVEELRFQALSGNVAINDNGVIVNVDYEFPGTFTPSMGGTDRWDIAGVPGATADPVRDIKTFCDLFQSEASGFTARTIMMNLQTFEWMVRHENVRAQIKNIQGVTQLQAMQRYFDVGYNLNFVVYNEGYVNDAGTFVKFIPNGKVIILGQDNMVGGPIGEFTSTLAPYPTIQSPTAGYFSIADEEKDPVAIAIIGGFYGLPALHSNKAVVYATVA